MPMMNGVNIHDGIAGQVTDVEHITNLSDFKWGDLIAVKVPEKGKFWQHKDDQWVSAVNGHVGEYELFQISSYGIEFVTGKKIEETCFNGQPIAATESLEVVDFAGTNQYAPEVIENKRPMVNQLTFIGDILADLRENIAAYIKSLFVNVTLKSYRRRTDTGNRQWYSHWHQTGATRWCLAVRNDAPTNEQAIDIGNGISIPAGTLEGPVTINLQRRTDYGGRFALYAYTVNLERVIDAFFAFGITGKGYMWNDDSGYDNQALDGTAVDQWSTYDIYRITMRS